MQQYKRNVQVGIIGDLSPNSRVVKMSEGVNCQLSLIRLSVLSQRGELCLILSRLSEKAHRLTVDCRRAMEWNMRLVQVQ